ncbi:hypothetical protein [Kitasatospora sp. NPDC056184]|uniref:hypothetical protein n=1 Tax=Kitasatospora sp. NPDC056184 TaxID=3345738 RepID=UPI0035DA4C4C
MTTRSRSVWQQMPAKERRAIGASVGSAGLPTAALALYARWWQLETWLRSLLYVELRAAHGVDWASHIGQGALSRQEKDKLRTYMASPDWDDPLAYLDVGKLFPLLDNSWDLVGPSLFEQSAFQGRVNELLAIRNRIGHLRRPHADDLSRLEQTLRDLEKGAFEALASYNREAYIDEHLQDPVADAWIAGNHRTARRLIDHAQRQYDTDIRVTYTKRPWAGPLDSGDPISGSRGYLWRVDFIMRGRHLNIPALWRDSYLDRHARKLLVHLIVRHASGVSVVFPAVDNSVEISDAIGDVFDAVLANSSTFPPGVSLKGDYLARIPPLDPRVQISTGWTIVDDTTVPITIFAA